VATAALTPNGPAQQEGREEGRGRRERAGSDDWAAQAEKQRNSFSFSNLIFQIRFQKIFKSFWHLNKTRHCIK
jgi:hypothetical protein